MSGASLGDKKVFWVEPGDFVLNIVFAWEGAVGIVSEAEAGMIGSHRFPTFRPDAARLDTRFLLHHFRTKEGLDAVLRVSPGGAGRNRTLSRKAQDSTIQKKRTPRVATPALGLPRGTLVLSQGSCQCCQEGDRRVPDRATP